MGCPSNVFIGDDLVFAITTHDPDTGILTDAAANPIYRVYEDLNPVALATGNMPKLDDVNTTGFYAQTISSIGWVEGRTYSIYIEATVAAPLGGMTYGVKAQTKTGYATTQADQRNSADEFLNRDLAGGDSVTDRDVRNALRILRNRREISALGVINVYDETDLAVAWTGGVTTIPGNPVNSMDPA